MKDKNSIWDSLMFLIYLFIWVAVTQALFTGLVELIWFFTNREFSEDEASGLGWKINLWWHVVLIILILMMFISDNLNFITYLVNYILASGCVFGIGLAGVYVEPNKK